MVARPTPAVDKSPRRLSDFDTASLASFLSRHAGCSVDKGRRTAAKIFRHAFADGGAWDDGALEAAGVGRWARRLVLPLSPAPRLEIAERSDSGDGSVRLLLRTHDGHYVESVIIPAEAGRDFGRTTLCISSQVGCARACTFCETGVAGLERQLTAGEIVDQYRLALDICSAGTRPLDARGPAAPRPEGLGKRGRKRRAALMPISNIVFMGMGEPFDNLTQVLRAIGLLTEQHAFDFAASRITVSTVGVADKLATFFAATRAELAISINAPDDARRSTIMPINARFDLRALREALVSALPPRRRVLFQYALFAGFNDALADADALAAWIGDIPCRVNVIPANPGPDPALRSPGDDEVDAFVARLAERGITTLVRRPRGRDVGGACGQLAGARRLSALRRPSERT